MASIKSGTQNEKFFKKTVHQEIGNKQLVSDYAV